MKIDFGLEENIDEKIEIDFGCASYFCNNLCIAYWLYAR